MNYAELKIQKRYIGSTIKVGSRDYVLSDDMPTNEKRYIYNMVTKHVFDIFAPARVEVALSAPVTEKEMEIIEVKSVAPAAAETSSTSSYEDYTLNQLKEMFPNVKAKTKKAFIAKLNK